MCNLCNYHSSKTSFEDLNCASLQGFSLLSLKEGETNLAEFLIASVLHAIFYIIFRPYYVVDSYSKIFYYSCKNILL